MEESTKAFISTGTVQCYVVRSHPFWMCHFGRAQYDRDLPILTDSLREQAQPIVDALNEGRIDTVQAEKLLGRIWI